MSVGWIGANGGTASLYGKTARTPQADLEAAVCRVHSFEDQARSNGLFNG